MLHYMPCKKLEHPNKVKNQTHTVYAFNYMINGNIFHSCSSFRLYGVTFYFLFKHTCTELLYLLIVVAGQYQDYHRHRLHALMSKNPHLDDLHLLLCQSEFLQQMHYRSGHTRRKKSRWAMVFYSVYNWIYYIQFLLHLNWADDTL